jgi:hypothetical protein
MVAAMAGSYLSESRARTGEVVGVGVSEAVLEVFGGAVRPALGVLETRPAGVWRSACVAVLGGASRRVKQLRPAVDVDWEHGPAGSGNVCAQPR